MLNPWHSSKPLCPQHKQNQSSTLRDVQDWSPHEQAMTSTCLWLAIHLRRAFAAVSWTSFELQPTGYMAPNRSSKNKRSNAPLRDACNAHAQRSQHEINRFPRSLPQCEKSRQFGLTVKSYASQLTMLHQQAPLQKVLPQCAARSITCLAPLRENRDLKREIVLARSFSGRL